MTCVFSKQSSIVNLQAAIPNLASRLKTIMREEAGQLSNAREGRLLAGYREMANDQEHEAEALEWCEGLIGDVARQEG